MINGFSQGGFTNLTPPPRLDVSGINRYYDANMKALEIKQAQWEQERVQAERERENEKQRTKAKMQQIKSYYSSVSKYPERLGDGWHNVVVMDNYDYCEDRKVFVSNNQITKYFKDDWIERKVTFAGSITNGKTLIKVISDGNEESDFLDVYFIEDILNPAVSTSSPKTPGKVSFWTNYKNPGNLKVYFNEIYLGTFEGYFPKDAPLCGQDGTLSLSYKPGTYSFMAMSEVGQQLTWRGTITIPEGGCILQGLEK